MGVDFAGLSDHNVINKVYKACLLLFTCLVTKKRGKTKSISFQTFKSTELKNFLRDMGVLFWKSCPSGEGFTKE